MPAFVKIALRNRCRLVFGVDALLSFRTIAQNQLHNFGGRINLHGDIRGVAENRFAAAAPEIPQCVGMGLFSEAIGQNPVFYDCVFEQIWRDGPVDADAWVIDYATRRLRRKMVHPRGLETAHERRPLSPRHQRRGEQFHDCRPASMAAKKWAPTPGSIFLTRP